MNKLWKGLYVGGLVAGLSLATGMVRAEDNAAPADGNGAPAGNHGDWGKGGNGGEKMKEKLGLSDAQVAKIKAMREASKPQMEALRKKQKADWQSLKDKQAAGAKDAELKPLLSALAQDRENMEAARKKNMEQMKQILTPDQQAKMVLGMGERREEFRKKMKDKKDAGSTGMSQDGAPSSGDQAPAAGK